MGPVERAPSPLRAWLAEHLEVLMGRVELGIFCAGQSIRLDQIASPLLSLPETVRALVDHLAERGRLRPFAAALLADEATAALAREGGLPQLLGESAGTGQPRGARFCHALLRAAIFTGRTEELSLLDWAWQEGARVMAVTGPPGSGKTAIVQQWLEGRGLSDPKRWRDFGVEGLFVWSFHADMDVASFLRAAADYVEGRAPLDGRQRGDEASRRSDLRRLLQALERSRGHLLLVLDGLERFQAAPPLDLTGVPVDPGNGYLDGPPVRPGEILEPCLRALLTEMAAVDGEAALLCTLDREVPSLFPWRGSGYVAVPVPPLPVAEGVKLLRQCGVTRGGDSDAERRCAEHGGHALTLDLLGRYLSAYYRGDARAVTVSELPPNDTTRLFEAPTLLRVLKAHVQALTEPQRGLLDLCVVLPGPTPISSLLALSQVAQEHPVAQGGGPLPVELLLQPLRGLSAAELTARLQELARLGLLTISGDLDDAVVDVHPLLRRQIYRGWLDARSGRSSSSSSMHQPDAMPGPQEGVILDLLEQLVLVALEAGLLGEAYDLLCTRMGGYPHLGRNLGEYRRLLAVLRILSPVLCTVAETDAVWARRCARMTAWEAETLRTLGQISEALQVADRRIGSEPVPGAVVWRLKTHLLAGQLRLANAAAGEVLHGAHSTAGRALAALCKARVLRLLGEVSLCRAYLMDAALTLREEPDAVCEWDGLSLEELLEWERAELLLCAQQTPQAREIALRCQAAALREGRGRDQAYLDMLLGEVAWRERDPLDAAQAVHRALSWGSRTGDVEILARAGLCHARIRLDTGNLDGAASALGMALPTAVDNGLQLERIDLLIVRGHLLLRRGDIDAAEEDARDALAYATAPGCGYLWGEADALHMLAMVLLSGRPPGARILEAASHLQDELDLRERMLDPRAQDVRWLLKRLTG